MQVGSYGLRDADGRMRTVNYVADALGYRATISTNEPGVDPHQVPAATTLNGNAPIVPAYHAAPIAVAHAAPLAHGPIGYDAPLAHGPLLAHGAPVAYSSSIGHGVVSHGAPLLAAPALHGAPLGLAHGAQLGYGKGYGLGHY